LRMQFVICLGAAVITWAAAAIPNAYAAPLTLRFHATITTVAPGIPFESGINFAVGDTVSGQFAFEPAEDNSTNPFSSIQFEKFSLSVNGAQIVAPSYQMRSWNDNGITDFPPATVVDDLSLEGAELVSASGTPFPNINPSLSAFRMSLLGHSHLITRGIYPDSVATWNAFDLERQLTLVLRDGNGGAVSFQATIGDFILVPEPRASAYVLVLVCTALSLWVSSALRALRFFVRSN
jgi:hypothetical protein